MLYPQEDVKERRSTGRKVLKYVCRNCTYFEDVSEVTYPIHKNVIVHTANEKMAITYDVLEDKTLPRTFNANCPECQGKQAVYYQSPVGKNDEALVLIFVCVNCGNRWLSSDE
ncbi:DNA-directed RNA polymerases II, IV and V subunit 9A [Gracilariopsis chorda]|uniref:DNA-directed RNA polymerases II, IV and V subunit 9A n=1 Tax=Gracilariopsis chorda TaxID=448386 RepID=A0A2V3J281_9FLOR|nr:DNA-directed RNA polymerases II, IV and V subunit 9A [Gracilariopsis chorda]|eukprot:PXF48504.1 DNA-directed RNA polymerases II, IV and V subunit 9A [Gracilariopsis chorda]